MKIIKSKNNTKIKYFKSLNLKKYRLKNKQYLIEGKNLCNMAIKFGYLIEVLLTKKYKFVFTNKTYVTKEIINYISNLKNPDNIIGLVRFNDKIKFNIQKHYLLLDNIQDPGNLGTILRSALAFGFHNIVLSSDTVDLYNSKVLRATQGAHFQLNIFRNDLINFINQNDLYYIGTDLNQKSFNLTTIPKNKKYALILGNENSGIKLEISKKINYNYVIEIASIDSLNVAIAGSIIMEKLR